MLELASLQIWAIRVGLLGSFIITLFKYETSSVNSYSPALIIFAIVAATFVPSEYYNIFKKYAPMFLGNTTEVLMLLFIVFAAAVVGLLINEEILPAFARLLRTSEESSAWVIVALFFLIIPNIKLISEMIGTRKT